jgi:uncharacterized cupredoxin-like copper-binding protein
MFSPLTHPRNLSMVLLPVSLLTLLLLSGCSMSTSQSVHNPPRRVTIDESDFHIASSIMTFTPEIPYHFVVANHGHVEHELMLLPAKLDTTNGLATHSMDQIAFFEITHLAPGQTRTLDFTFPASSTGLILQFACHYPGYFQAGMSLTVQVGLPAPNS